MTLREIVAFKGDVIREGKEWLIVYKDGKDWESFIIWSDVWNGVWDVPEKEDAELILEIDRDAIILNGYYCSGLDGDASLEEGIRQHYNDKRCLLRNYVENVSVFA